MEENYKRREDMKFDMNEGVITKVYIEEGDISEDILKLTLPEGATVIGQGAFKGVQLPPILWIKEGATEIAPLAFAEHKELRSVSFPSSMRKIGSKAFKDCEGLSNIDFHNNNMFAIDCFEGDYLISWLRKDGEVARTLYFPREKVYAIMLESRQLSTPSYKIYRGRFCTTPGFPNCEADTDHPLLYFCSYVIEGKETVWYDTLLEWAIKGARYQAYNMTPREFLGREITFDGESSMTLNEFGVIMGMCASGIKFVSIWLGEKRDKPVKISKTLIKTAKAFAPFVWRKFEDIINHQNEVWPVGRDYFHHGIRWTDHWSSTGKTKQEGIVEVFQILEERGARYDYNKWAY